MLGRLIESLGVGVTMESMSLLASRDPQDGVRTVGRWTFAPRELDRHERLICLTQNTNATTGRRNFFCGSEAMLHPSWIENQAASVRSQVRRVQKKGVRIHIVPGPTPEGLPDLQRIRRAWIKSKGFLRLNYLTEPSARFNWTGTPLALVTVEGRLVGFAVILVNAQTVLLEAFYRTSECPNGTTELLLETCLKHFDHSLSLGLSPQPDFLGAPLSWLCRQFYSFESLWTFRSRLRPSEIRPTFINLPDHLSRMGLAFILAHVLIFSQNMDC